ncbi:MAG: hypothetical protein H7245_14825 [Candidatus Saccharibacteria bacterium]|nr:hypothetical protein [Pseudorhodobacter sp.]
MRQKGNAISLDRLYILTGFVWLILGMVFGIYIGITDQTTQSNAHAHANLLGFVISVLFGLMYRNWPNMTTSRLRMIQYGIYQIGVVALVIGKYQIAASGVSAIIAPGSVVVVLGTLMMMWIFATKAH